MARGKCKFISCRTQCILTHSEASSSTTASAGYPTMTEKLDNDLKFDLTELIEVFKEYIKNSLKEIQENTVKQVKKLKKIV